MTADNIADTVIADGFVAEEEICTGDFAQDFCKAQAIKTPARVGAPSGRPSRPF